jgi:signal transduction histidine kinase
MKLHLASDSGEVQRLCREVLSELIGRGWVLQVGNGTEAETDADLYVWDFEPGTTNPRIIPASERWRHFYLVSRSDVQAFREAASWADSNLLLKPVTKAALAAFFTEACERCKEVARRAPGAETLEGLRADRDELLQCLIETNLKLQEYDHDRTTFLARAIHDFRAPLTAITGYCGLLLGDDLGTLSAQQREVLERMQNSAKRLSRMATAMFQLSIAPRAELALDLRENDIRECVHGALEEVLAMVEEKRISISVDIAEPPEPLRFEFSKLQQVVINLVDNACKFTPRAGTIDIAGYPYFWDRRIARRVDGDSVPDRRQRLSEVPNSYRVDIRDSGPGIPPAHVVKIFEEYTSYSGGVDRSGGGLGLAICRMIMNHHRGHIWAESSADGARFSFVLPFYRAERTPAVPAADAALYRTACVEG